jgi:hypothetical protein
MWDTCPKCGGVAVTVCCCPMLHSECMEGHTWRVQIKTLERVETKDEICRKNLRRRREDGHVYRTGI